MELDEIKKGYCNCLSDLQILKDSLVGVKQRLDRIERYCRMPEAERPKAVWHVESDSEPIMMPSILHYTDLPHDSVLEQDAIVKCSCCSGNVLLKKGHLVDHKGAPYCDTCDRDFKDPKKVEEVVWRHLKNVSAERLMRPDSSIQSQKDVNEETERVLKESCRGIKRELAEAMDAWEDCECQDTAPGRCSGVINFKSFLKERLGL